MRGITLSGKTKADDYTALNAEIASILNGAVFSDENTDFQSDEDCITEYDLTEENDAVVWSIDFVSWNENGTASHAQISC